MYTDKLVVFHICLLRKSKKFEWVCIYIYIYMRACVCMCVCACYSPMLLFNPLGHKASAA